MKSSLTGDGTIRVHSGSQKEEKAMTKMTKKKKKPDDNNYFYHCELIWDK